MGHRALGHYIEASSVDCIGAVWYIACRIDFPQSCRLIGLHTGASCFFVEETCCRQCIVAHHLCRQSVGGPPGQPFVLRIHFAKRCRGKGRLLIGIGENDQFDDMLQIPSGFPELHRQPVEQFRMRRQGSLVAKVLACLYESHAKELLPNAVHSHSCREGMIGMRQPLCESISVVGQSFWKAKNLFRCVG